MSPNFWGCRCCGNQGVYDVLSYDFDGSIVRRQYHGHGGYNLIDGAKPGWKISVSVDQGVVVCASDTNLSSMEDSRSGNATRLHEGWISYEHLLVSDSLCLAGLADGRLARGNWRVSKKSHGGDWWVSCTSVVNNSSETSKVRVKRAWKLTEGVTLDSMPAYNVPVGDLDGDIWQTPESGPWTYWNGTYLDPELFVDGTIPQSVLGGDQVIDSYYGSTFGNNGSSRFGFDGRISYADLQTESYPDRYQFYQGGAMLHYSAPFAWVNRFPGYDDGPVSYGNTGDTIEGAVSVALGELFRRVGEGSDANVLYYDSGLSDFIDLDTPIASIDENNHWHGIRHMYIPSGSHKSKTGFCVYRELDLNDTEVSHDLLGNTYWPTKVRSVTSPFGTIGGSAAIPKDVFVKDGFMYALLPDESDAKYWRRLVKIDIEDFSVVWTKAPPEDWQCFHSITLEGDALWAAVSASDGSVFSNPT